MHTRLPSTVFSTWGGSKAHPFTATTSQLNHASTLMLVVMDKSSAVGYRATQPSQKLLVRWQIVPPVTYIQLFTHVSYPRHYITTLVEIHSDFTDLYQISQTFSS